MGTRRVTRLGLPEDVALRLCARGLLTAGEVLVRSDVELLHLLDMPLSSIRDTRLTVSRLICPPTCTVLDLVSIGGATVRLRTQLPNLDNALGGGLPCGSVTELVGPSGMGKSQLCLMLALTATLPEEMGGLDGRVVMFDTEHKFSSLRLVEIARTRFPGLFAHKGDEHKLVERVVVISPSSAADLLARLRGLQAVMVRDAVKLIIVDSVAALMRTNSESGSNSLWQRQEVLGQLAVSLKELGEGFSVPVVVTNQVRAASEGTIRDSTDRGARGYSGQARRATDVASTGVLGPGDVRWGAALGVKWAHAVNVRLAFSSTALGGVRTIQIAKAPMAPPFITQYSVSSAGVEELEEHGEDGAFMH